MSYDVNFIRENLGYDQHTGVLFWKKPGPGRVVGKVVGHKDRNGHLVWSRTDTKPVRKSHRYMVHRVIWVLVHGEMPFDQIDHINGVKDDNRLANLRQATNADNMRNVGKQSHNTSGLKGVSFHKLRRKWRADIMVNQKQIALGLFECPAVASFAYQIAADNYHGEFARAF
jgi:hypothetical protein